MDIQRFLILSMVSVIITVGFLSGPVVSVIDFERPTTEDDSNTIGSGGAEVSVLSTPDEARLVKGRFSSDAPYTLRVPDATIQVANVTGKPVLVYKIQIRDLGHTRSTAHIIDASWEGRTSIGIDPSRLEQERVQQETYNAELRIVLRFDGTEHVIHDEKVTVAVES